uniref:Complexin-1 n=1 Tax=Gasterosteus aculeatus aculeatus TaxID=481459 RepID=A0AAQ4P0Y8_GASAC
MTTRHTSVSVQQLAAALLSDTLDPARSGAAAKKPPGHRCLFSFDGGSRWPCLWAFPPETPETCRVRPLHCLCHSFFISSFSLSVSTNNRGHQRHGQDARRGGGEGSRRCQERGRKAERENLRQGIRDKYGIKKKEEKEAEAAAAMEQASEGSLTRPKKAVPTGCGDEEEEESIVDTVMKFIPTPLMDMFNKK